MVTETEAEVAEFPAASAITAVKVCAACESPVVSIVAEKLVPLQVAPAPLAEPSTLIVTAWLASLQVPLTTKPAELFEELIELLVAGEVIAIDGAKVSTVNAAEQVETVKLPELSTLVSSKE